MYICLSFIYLIYLLPVGTYRIAIGKHKTLMINKEKTTKIWKKNVQIYYEIIIAFINFHNNPTKAKKYENR